MHPSAEVVFRKLGDAAVLVHLGTNDIFELNDTGVRIWDLVLQQLPVDAIVATLVAEFAVDESTARDDTTALIGELQARGLLTST
jgi:hypothetical protein